ncbi:MULTISPECIES: pyridoxal phosphate-dependent aminotransferase family protein [Streptomyces]|uniref:8-amino-7-oxononanoate synthase n=1 Tax=Streptomyces sviceus (strain ATCC 29083 / DSM 924 / JCM 4929 / NBRC 13980 / NCIMB 11184 / NRRL 5439 / UC 5370) TaxID=463191 RepID=B5I3L0_STRX2|nr:MULTISPECIES: pyridoxal phosphate-dependent aminotransferase family protein [Streptomyces]EDY59665.1 2-amino-3-ketobutyrate coenzyme A ligase [Streptomyces sviceus ATCC 29083]
MRYRLEGPQMDLFAKTKPVEGTLGSWAERTHGLCAFPKLRGEISNRMSFGGRECVVWSINNYLGLANDPEIRAVDAKAAAEYGLAAPMGSRMMSGESDELEYLEGELADYAGKPAAFFMNFGYPGMSSMIDALAGRHDVIVYDAHCHACIVDGVVLHQGKHFAFPHNDIAALTDLLERVSAQLHPSGGILVVTEGVFGMSGDLGRLDEIVRLKERFDFRLLVDDAHGFGVTGPSGGGTGEHFGVQDGIDLYFGTFAKAGASIGAFVAGASEVVSFLRYNTRSQIFSKGLPMPVVVGNRARLRLMRTRPEAREALWSVAGLLQRELRARGLEVGATQSPVTPVYLDMDTEGAVEFIRRLRDEHGVFASLVTYPVVPRGVTQLRLTPTALHTADDVARTVEAIEKVYFDLVGRA